jgi:cell division transport system permease protein
MKSIKNHFSLIVALFAILFSIQILIVNSRAIQAYEAKLSSNYSMIVVSNNDISEAQFKKYSKYIVSTEKLSPAKIISTLKQNISQQNLQLLEVSMPRFYRLHFDHYPTPGQIKTITATLFKNSAITKVQDFSKSYNTTFKLLLLFKLVTQIFTVTIFIVTTLLIIKEMRIWQFKHTERMNIMGLFGAPIWLRSAVLFRLAIVDALIASALVIISFIAIAHTQFMKTQLSNIDISIHIFQPLSDGAILGSTAIVLSILLASIIVIGYKEEI